LKLIQVGVTICDEQGNYPPEISTWQFNLKFDLNNDQYSHESITLLTNSGINFKTLARDGIPLDIFGEYLITSGLLLNEDINWVSFHGIYDFAYLLKVITGLPLPETEMNFIESLKLYFPHHYDIRHIVRYIDNLRGSLSKLGQELNINRIGIQHQAGSDSIITSEIFFKLKKEYFTEDIFITDKNVLFGLTMGEEIDYAYGANYFGITNIGLNINSMNTINNLGGLNTINNPLYTQNITTKVNNNSNLTYNINSNNNVDFPNPNFYSQNLIGLPYNYSQARNAVGNSNNFYPHTMPTINNPINSYHYAYTQGNLNYNTYNLSLNNNLSPNTTSNEDKKNFR
jgi:CCR4-NOT transcription complex subunit 7/8